MPELPEMENYKRIFTERLVGKTVSDVTITREKSINVTIEQFKSSVINQTIIGVERRAKHLIFWLGSGNCLLLHLMLGGTMYIGNENDNPERTKQVTLTFGNIQLFFIGLRLGYLHLLNREELEQKLADLGPEPLSSSFTTATFLGVIEKKRGALKTTLVNQKVLAGIGNLYSDEICFAAKLLPKRRLNELSEEEKLTLYHSMQAVLQRGIELGGYMDMPVFSGDKLTGNYNQHCYVYDKEGEPCPRCQAPIKREEISSRKSFFCGECQS